jgi:hypothetical protein
VTILPSKLDGIIANRSNFLNPCARRRNECPLRAVALAQRTGTVTPQVFCRILADMTVIPSDPNDPALFAVIDFGWELRRHKV